MRDVVKKIEQADIPAVAIIFEDMEEVSRLYKRQLGMPYMRDIIIPRITSHDKAISFAPELVPKLATSLTKPLTDEEKDGGIIPRERLNRIVVTGTWDQCQEYFQGGMDWAALWSQAPPARLTNGLPVVLPTEEKVEWMLSGTSHKPDELIGPAAVPDDQRQFTVETVAINAVMAGCRPEYMPVILAMAELMATPAKSRVSARGGGAHPLMGVVSGPMGKDLRMSTEKFGGEGYRVNFSMRLAMNLIGHNAVGYWDQNSWGSGFFAEDTDNSPWTPLGADAGYKPDENVFALCSSHDVNQSCVCPSLYRADGKFLERLVPCIRELGNTLSVVIIIHPSVANDLAAKGMSKEDVKRWLWENTTETMGHYRERQWFGVLRSMQLREGPFNRTEIFDLPDESIIPTLKGPEMIQIIVAGIPMEFGYVAAGPMWLPSEMITSR